MIRPLLLAALVLSAPAGALAAPGGSPRWGSVDVGAQIYTPAIDDEFATRPGPYERIFGAGRSWMFQLGVSRALYTGFGSLEAGVRSGYFRRTGNSIAQDGTLTEVETTLHIIPTSASLTYRFDWPVERYRIPLAPYVRGTLERYNWWVSDFEGKSESGATNGWSATAGLALLLDILDPGSARDLDREMGVNHTYVFAELTKSSIDDFGSSSSWDLSNDDFALGLGLMFVF